MANTKQKTKNIWKILIIIVLDAVLIFSGLESTLRVLPDKSFHPFADNPITAAQSNDQIFAFDKYLGFKLNPYFRQLDGDYIDNNKTYYIGVHNKKLQTLDEIIDSLDNNRKTVLNVGDSSTTGWDSDIITLNKVYLNNAPNGIVFRPMSPFFRYKTYSDLLADNGLSVINVGVPGYTSLIGKTQLGALFSDLKSRNVRVDYVTIYFGNNDSASNGNDQDKYRFPNSGFHAEIFHFVETTLLRRLQIIGRVSVADYSSNIQSMIDMCRAYGVKPILIRPVIPKYWHPGLRASGQETEVWKAMYNDKGSKLIRDLEKAIGLYELAKGLLEHGSEQEARKLLIQAQGIDYMVPRIKPEYVHTLEKIARKNTIPFVDVQSEIPLDDRTYFKDYCHPIEPANQLITRDILKRLKMDSGELRVQELQQSAQ
jgi:lysophospholipase L1-like esterase